MKFKKLLKRCALFALAGAMCLGSCHSSKEESEAPEESNEGERRYTLVSVGKPYTLSADSNESYPDLFGQQLTDGQKIPDTGSFYTDVRMVGFNGKVRIDIDLGDDGKRIVAVAARSLDINQDGVRVALNATFSYSDDGSVWKSLGVVNFRSSGEQTVSTARVELDEPIDCRYIRVTYKKRTDVPFFFADEVEVFADVPEKEAVSALDASYADEQIDRTAWKSLSSGIKASPVSCENIVRGLAYKFSDSAYDERSEQSNSIAKNQPINTPATEFGKLLTDGSRTGRLVGEPVWVGVRASDAPSLSVQFSAERSDIYSVLLYMTDSGVDITLPDYVDVYASSSGAGETFIGRMYSAGSTGNYTYRLILPEYIKASGIRLQFPAGEGNYWMEELEVLAGTDEAADTELYPPVSFPKVTEELLWDKSEPDYKEYKNLAEGIIPQYDVSFCMDIPTHGDETPAGSNVLTDGKLSDDLYCYSGEWFFHRGGGAIDFYFDLEKLSSVDKVKISYLEHLDYGINHPNCITVYLSEDAENWYYIKSETYSHTASKSALRNTAEISFDRTYIARFVRVRIESAFLFTDEMEIYGTKQTASGAVRLADCDTVPVKYYTNEEDRHYTEKEESPINASDIIIVYGEKGDENSLLPLVAYLDENGKIKDTFMDGFLYCPTGGMPSGAGAYEGTKKIDWDTLFTNTFDGINGFDALEQTVQQVKDELDKPDYTVEVYITLLYLTENVADFGDIDGDGVTEGTVTAEDRRRVIDWYIERCVGEFNARGYKNLRLGGFYNIHEAVRWGADDTLLIREFSDAVHDAGYPYLWIPYYMANRYYYAQELGFDLVCMQPNYAFDLYRDLYRFEATARRMKNIGGCIEIENSYQSLSDPLFARNYMLYLYYGATLGYMENTVHIYYDDINNFSKMAYTESELCRMQYDATYGFVKGTLQITPEERKPVSASGNADSVLRGSVAGDDALCNYTLKSAPEHGYVALASDGEFVYYPDKGYTGTDSFTYTYNKFLGESEECTVNIEIK